MNMLPTRYYKFRLCSIHWVALWLLTVSMPSWSGVIPKTEREALISIYQATGGDQWLINSNWCEGTCPPSGTPRFNKRGTECTWFGVICGNTDHVLSLELDSVGLRGELPSLSAFTALQTLALPRNAISGVVPPDVVSIPSLTDIDLRSNQLTGALPDFSKLPNLIGIELSDNQLSGEIGPLSNLLELQDLQVSNNQLSGPLPSFAGLYWLTTIIIDHNQFIGPLPDFSQSNTDIFYADHNELSGPLLPPSDAMRICPHCVRLCPNPLSLEPGPYDTDWANILRETPWWGPPGGGCDHIFSSTFDEM